MSTTTTMRSTALACALAVTTAGCATWKSTVTYHREAEGQPNLVVDKDGRCPLTPDPGTSCVEHQGLSNNMFIIIVAAIAAAFVAAYVFRNSLKGNDDGN